MKFPTPAEVLAMSDEELAEFMGVDAQMRNLRSELEEIEALSGKAKEEAYQMWDERMAPRISSGEVRWIKEDAIRSANPKKVLDDESPSSIM